MNMDNCSVSPALSRRKSIQNKRLRIHAPNPKPNLDENSSEDELCTYTRPKSKKQKNKENFNLKSLVSPEGNNDNAVEVIQEKPLIPKEVRKAQVDQNTRNISENSSLKTGLANSDVDVTTEDESFKMQPNRKEKRNEKKNQQENILLATCLDGLVVDQILCGAEVENEKYFLTQFKNVKNYMLVRIEDANCNFAQDVIKYYESKINWCDTPDSCEHSPLEASPSWLENVKLEICTNDNTNNSEKCCQPKVKDKEELEEHPLTVSNRCKSSLFAENKTIKTYKYVSQKTTKIPSRRYP